MGRCRTVVEERLSCSSGYTALGGERDHRRPQRLRAPGDGRRVGVPEAEIHSGGECQRDQHDESDTGPRGRCLREPRPGRERTARACPPMRSCAENSCSRAARTNDSSKTSERYSSSPPGLSGGPSGGSSRPVMTSPDLRATGGSWRWDPPGHLAPGGPVRHGFDRWTSGWPSPRGRGRGGGITRSYLQIGSILIKVNASQVGAQAERGRAGSGAAQEKSRPGPGPAGRTARGAAEEGREGWRDAGPPGRVGCDRREQLGKAAGEDLGLATRSQVLVPRAGAACRCQVTVLGQAWACRTWGRRAPAHSAAEGVRGTAETAGRE